jgi:hypothetical protein
MRALAIAAVSLAAVAWAEPSGVNMSGLKEQSMARCPSAVEGARTEVIDLADGVEVWVTADDPRAEGEIRRRADLQADASKLGLHGPREHTGLSTGSGRFGFCPGVVQQTRLTAADVPGGTRMTIKPFDPRRVSTLQRITHERARALRDEPRPAKGGAS